MTGEPYSKERQLARGERRYRRKVASPKQWQAIIAAKGSACRLRDHLARCAVLSDEEESPDNDWRSVRIARRHLKALYEDYDELRLALCVCAEIAGEDGEAVEGYRMGAVTKPRIGTWAIGAVQQLRDAYDEEEDEHEPWTPQEGDRAYRCDQDSCRIAPHYAKHADGAYLFHNGTWEIEAVHRG